MNAVKVLLVLSTLAIYALTVIATVNHGPNWPAVALNDLAAFNWRTQFDFDFIVYLLIFATWVVWREGATAKAYAFGILSILMGGMFGFPYLIYAIFKAKGQPQACLLGVHATAKQ